MEQIRADEKIFGCDTVLFESNARLRSPPQGGAARASVTVSFPSRNVKSNAYISE